MAALPGAGLSSRFKGAFVASLEPPCTAACSQGCRHSGGARERVSSGAIRDTKGLWGIGNQSSSLLLSLLLPWLCRHVCLPLLSGVIAVDLGSSECAESP